MSFVRSLALALVSAAVCIAVVLGASSLSLAEGFSLAEAPTAPAETATPPIGLVVTSLPTSTELPKLVTATPLPACTPPKGWNPYIVQSGDTMDWLSVAYNTTDAEIMKSNCLTSRTLIPGSRLYLPALPVTSTPSQAPSATVMACTHPSGWIAYTIQPGDSYFYYSTIFGMSLNQLMTANCTSTYTLIAGNTVWLPYYPPPRPTLTPVVPTWTSSPAPTSETQVPPTATTEVPAPTTNPSATLVPEPATPTTAAPETAPTIAAPEAATETPVPAPSGMP